MDYYHSTRVEEISNFRSYDKNRLRENFDQHANYLKAKYWFGFTILFEFSKTAKKHMYKSYNWNNNKIYKLTHVDFLFVNLKIRNYF